MSEATDSPTGSSTKPSVDLGEDNGPLLARLFKLQSVWILCVLIGICLIFSLAAGSKFFAWSNISTITQNVSIWAVLGVGMTFVIITSGIDLSIGSVLVFSSVVSAKVMEAIGGDGVGVALAGVVAAVASGICWGLLNGVLIARAKIPPLIVTLGTLSIALGLAQIITGGLDIRAVPDSLTDTIGYGRFLGIPMLTLIALIILVIGGIILHKTRFGRYTYAVGSNEEAARRVGVKVSRHLIKVYGMTGMLAGFQSLTNLNVIAAVVIGGTSIFGGEGSIFGTVVGLFIPAVLLSGFTILGVTPYWQTVAVGTVLIAAVYVDQSRRAAATRGAKPRRKAKPAAAAPPKAPAPV